MAGDGDFLEHLLVAALDRAITFTQVDAMAVRVEQDLDLHVAGTFDEAFDDQPIVAEGGHRLAPRGGQRLQQPVWVPDRAHPLAPTAGRRLDDEREADPTGRPSQDAVGLPGAVVAGQDRDAEGGRQPTCCRLVAHRPDGRRREGRPSGSPPPRPARRNPRSRRGTRNQDGGRRRRRQGPPPRRPTGSSRSRPCGPSVTGMTARMPSRWQVRLIRSAISPRFAMNTVRINGLGIGPPRSRPASGPANASSTSDATRHRPPTRRAGSTPGRDPALDGSW